MISRGYQRTLTVAPAPVAPAAAEPPTPESDWVGDRLSALERLAQLFERGALTAEEFAAAKAFMLDPQNVPAPQRGRPEPGPSLLGRLFDWWIIPVGLVAGLALSFASQPRETTRFLEEALRVIGA